MSTTAVGSWPVPKAYRPQSARGAVMVAVLALPAAAALGAIVSRAPELAALATVALLLGTLIFFRPAVAGYLVIGVTPLIVGIDRGRILPVLRPNEALILLAAGALLARGIWNLRTGVRLRPRIGLVVGSLILMAVFNSAVPLLWMAVRGVSISADDLMYAIVLWKYLALYAVVRASVRSDRDVRRCLWLAMIAACIVAVIAILQSLDLFGVPRLLASYYTPAFSNDTRLSNNRGSSTLALPAATADLMIFNLALAAGFWRRYGLRQLALWPIAVLFVVGTLASGQFSGAIGLLVAMIAIGLVSRRADLPLVFGLVGLGATWLLRPVIAHRLSGFQRVSGLPESWVGRLRNLRSYFWPKLFSHENFLLGVQPSARVPGPRDLGIKWVWIESGYTWLLWGGGIPLLLSFVLFVVVSVRRSWALAQRPDAVGIAATAVFAGVLVVTVLMSFDPHITYRGSADLLFSLLALIGGASAITGTRSGASARAAPTSAPPRWAVRARSRRKPVVPAWTRRQVEMTWDPAQGLYVPRGNRRGLRRATEYPSRSVGRGRRGSTRKRTREGGMFARLTGVSRGRQGEKRGTTTEE